MLNASSKLQYELALRLHNTDTISKNNKSKRA